jgi:hypothetical protein
VIINNIPAISSDKQWDAQKKSWFGSYAYPYTDEVWGIWSNNPLEWRPINHSCDPNSWLVGLDVVAKRDIKKDEQITMEYATFCVDNMSTFTCSCGSGKCRGTITGKDYLQPWVGEQYSSHVSDYVNTKRNNNKH